MSIAEELGPEEYARQLRNPTGKTGLAVAEMLNETNGEGNLLAIKQLQLMPNASVLEIGCSTGSMAKVVIEQAENIIYTGIDSSDTVISAAREQNSGLIAQGLASFHHAYAEQMPFVDASFTDVFSIGVIHFWSDPIKSFSEIFRVMRPGARMVMGCLGPENTPPFARAEYGFHLHDAQTWRSYCFAAGFSTVELEILRRESENAPQFFHLIAQV
ncbi:class I SAM-dependent methyltransferase [Kosakonia sp. BYX6]|uniref:Class I SAM-dependent methyltransferase n=1 Tax=Kosakonia calanthes TaxID=3139408 RepID=A0ABZ3B0Q1_9ENTR